MSKQTQFAQLAGMITQNLPEMSSEVMQKWIGSPKRLQEFLAGLAVEETPSFITHTFTIVVDKTKTVEELVKDGKFDWSNDGIVIVSKNFPKPANGAKSEKEVVLFHFNKNLSSDTAIEEMKKAGYRPATILELLAFGAVQPDLQREFPIVALGSVATLRSFRCVGCLSRLDSGRGVSLRYYGIDWYDSCRFLGVRN